MVEKLWLSQYQKGVPSEVDTKKYASLSAYIDEACEQHANTTAFINFNCKLTYKEVKAYSDYFANYLLSIGLEKGDRVALMMPNILQYPIAIFGVLKAGLVVVNTNPLYTPDELKHQINDSGAKAILVLNNFASTVEKVLSQTPALKHVIVTEMGDLFPFHKALLVNVIVKYIKKMVPAFNIPHAITFKSTIKIGQNKRFEKPTMTQDDIAFLQYTGGTTGVSKGAVLRHGNLLANMAQAEAWIAPLNVNENDVIITALPLYHIFSLTANCLTFLINGCSNMLITNPRDTARFIKDIKNAKMSIMTGVNTLYNVLLNHPDFPSVDFSALKISLSGGMALQKNVALKWQEITKTCLLEAYGLTETSPAITMNPMNLTTFNGSIGLPLPSTMIEIRDDAGHALPIGQAGELCVKGPQVMQGYWHKPEETSNVFFEDGYLKTGDIAKIAEDGFVYLVERKKDMILVSGFNVYPNEVEKVISMHPGVLEVGVVGVQDNDSGERVKACIVKKDPLLTHASIIEHCREHLTAYKIPKIIQFYDELPKTNVGKILRRALR